MDEFLALALELAKLAVAELRAGHAQATVPLNGLLDVDKADALVRAHDLAEARARVGPAPDRPE